jgi:hypothetical protein
MILSIRAAASPPSASNTHPKEHDDARKQGHAR